VADRRLKVHRGTGIPRRSPSISRLFLSALLLCGLSLPPAEHPLAGQSLLPDDVVTHADGRQPIGRLFAEYGSLIDRGWLLDVVWQSRPSGRDMALPIVALRTPRSGRAVWILSGIHGEEPAGPNAIAAAIDALAELGEERAVVLLPMNNPHGYVDNWRYLNTATYSSAVEGQSVGDSSHLLADPDHPGRAHATAPSSPEAAAITGYILDLTARYPPVVSIDLHEDNLIDEGYVYSQGALGVADPLAAIALRVLRQAGIPLKTGGETRFGEEIEDGLIGPVTDSSIDELMSAGAVIVDGATKAGPNARTVLVFETPARGIDLARRIEAHRTLLENLAEALRTAGVFADGH
jgi:hypothetical protein